jgi:hypothetical protein
MLNELPVAMILARKGVREMHSARPDAPVVAEPASPVTRPRTYRGRAAVAATLTRVAEFVAPNGIVPARRTASSR